MDVAGSGMVKPAVPERSRRRSRLSEAESSPVVGEQPSLPVPSGMVTSTSMPLLACASKSTTRSQRASTTATSSTAPLRLGDKKCKRASTSSVARSETTPTMKRNTWGNSTDAWTDDAEGVSESSPSSVATSLGEASDPACLRTQAYRAKVDGALSSLSSMGAVPMGISQSHQAMIDASPARFHRTEAAGLFDSVRGLMHDLQLDIAQDRPAACDQHKDEVEADLRSWLASPQRSCAEPPTPAPTITVAAVETPTLVPAKAPQETEVSEASEAAVGRGLWSFLRTPSPGPARSPSASSYSSTSSFIPPSDDRASPLSFFSRTLLGRSTPELPLTPATDTTTDDLPLRLSPNAIDAVHVKSTASRLSTKLTQAHDRIDDLEDENAQLRLQIASLAEIVVHTEERLHAAEKLARDLAERNTPRGEGLPPVTAEL